MTTSEDWLAKIEAIADPVERARQALDQRDVVEAQLMRIRQDAVKELRAKGMTFGEIGQLLGVTRGRAKQLAEGWTSWKNKTRDQA